MCHQIEETLRGNRVGQVDDGCAPLIEVMAHGADSSADVAQNRVLRVEIQVDGTVGYTSPGRNVRDTGILKALLGDDLDGRFKDAVILFSTAR